MWALREVEVIPGFQAISPLDDVRAS